MEHNKLTVVTMQIMEGCTNLKSLRQKRNDLKPSKLRLAKLLTD
jgi:Leucine-rich repeat (LRR) protein